MESTGLNPEQSRAVELHNGPLLILAGAGSGKTRVITHRISAMLAAGIPQRAILALTFTNKAAREMAQRVREMNRRELKSLTVSTFHSFGVSVLRRHITKLGYRENFSIYDQQDQIALLRESAHEAGITLEPGEAGRVLDHYSMLKTGRTTRAEIPSAYLDLFATYAEHLRVYNAVDFDDLIALPIRLFSEHAEVLRGYQNRFHYIMVDEFQDTSADQYELLRLIGSGHHNVAVVGDDDQSIYSWRGANFDNFLMFERDFPDFTEIKLERNYRSTDTILAAANGVIANNVNRKQKQLWTGTNGGRSIQLMSPDDESREGLEIAEQIKSLAVRDHVRYGDVGVLVRTNSLSRNLEVALLSENIPYRVSGGQSFFQRKEIKDLIAYLKLAANPDDDVSLLRVLNTPRRGIGRKTVQALVSLSERNGTRLFSTITAATHAPDSGLAGRTLADLEAFRDLIDGFQSSVRSGRDMAKALTGLVEDIDYWGHLVAVHPSNDRVPRWKYRNVQVFIEFVESYEKDPDNLSPSVFDFLSRVTLDPRDEIDEKSDPGKVNLSTIHAAKGLEYRVVFVAGCEDGIIPHARSLEEDPANLEEERRLFYVAITRAREKLYLSTCRTRKMLRERVECVPSPFLEEIPNELISAEDENTEVSEREGADYFAALKARFAKSET